MSEETRSDEADGGSRSAAPSVPEKEPPARPARHDDRWSLDEHGVWRERPGIRGSAPPRPGRQVRVAGWLGVAGVVALTAVVVLAQAGVFSSGKAATSSSGFQPTATDPALAAHQTATAFLTAWEHGQIRTAAGYTDHPDAAAAALNSYRDGLHLRGLHLSVRKATAQGTVAFSVVATVGLAATPSSSAAAPAQWSYTSHLMAYAKRGGWWIRWDPAVVAPGLTGAEKVVSLPIAPRVSEVVDDSGSNLANSRDPGLQHIAAALTQSAPPGQGIPGIEVAYASRGTTPVAGSIRQLSQPVDAGTLKTTIAPRVEAAARSAVQAHADSSMVVIQPSTGKILAVANNDGGNDFALTARVAPGSTNKIITSTALFTTGLVRSPNQPVDCPPQTDADGEMINNAGGESEPPGTPFRTDFAASCNNAFDRWYASMGSKTLAETAQKYYGLNQPWNIGIGQSFPYYTIPSAASHAELALELFGQGRLETAPLAMASVVATVDTGTFKQPIVVPSQPQIAATPLPRNVRRYLWQMMKAVTQAGGTAAGVFDSVSSSVYAKTGTADVGGQSQPNSWMVAFDPALNVAIGCVVLNAGYGAQVAGPEAATVLQLLSQRG
jgi:hypothetical protein